VQANDNLKTFESLLDDLDNAGILQDLVLIGSWALRVYREHFHNDPRIPIVATQDLDLLIPNPPEIKKNVNIPAILAKYDLEQVSSVTGGYSKFVSPDLEVEFLYPEKGSGESGGKIIRELGIVAMPLRYMFFIQSHTATMNYKGHAIRVPEPVTFVLMKYLLITKRKPGDLKVEKDLSTAREMEAFLLANEAAQDFRDIYGQMPARWRDKLMLILKGHQSELLDIL
jgi:hypothetical protein